MRIIIPANEAKVRDDALIVYSTNDPEDPAKLCEWVKWRDEYDKPNYTPALWSREIEPWVKVKENRYPEDDFYVEVLLRSGERANARVNQRDLVWMDFYGNLLDGVVAWFDTSLFPVPPKRDNECEEAWLKWSKGVTFQSDEDEARQREAWTACWKAARGMR